MPATSVVGLDTAKSVFQVHGVDSSWKVTLRKRLRRGQLTYFFTNLPVCIIGLEATHRKRWIWRKEE
jgi:transposase